MRASYGWLCELLPGLDAIPADEVARLLTGAGLEVEGIERYGAASSEVLVAKVVSKEPHPSRAKLSLVTVDLGSRTQRVVCGAPNVPEPGGLVVLAPLGTYLPAKDMRMEPREIAGVLSEGMLCSETELGLRAQGGHDGILILPPGTAVPGTRLSEAIPQSSDTIYEIGLTPNRPDGLGHLGLARELGVLARLAFAHTAPRPTRTKAELSVEAVVSLRIDDEERCPLYGAAYVEGVKVAPSPLGVAWRLEALGIRSISNVVDVTNLVMLAYGHPIHAFDLERVRGSAIVVRRAQEGEPLTTLDGVERKLVADDLVIADGEGPTALAGVMGGAGSEIHEGTSRVLVECAYFQPRGVRRTGRRHGLHTESSHRFERGVDHGDVEEVLQHTMSLLVELAGGTAAQATKRVGEGLPERAPIRLRHARLEALVGAPVPWSEVRRILDALGCRAASEADGEGSFVPPTHRPDLSMEEDLIEEVVRVRGMEAVPLAEPSIRPAVPRNRNAVGKRLGAAALELGLSEALTFGFTSVDALEKIGAPKPAFKLENPLSEDRTVMRTSLLPGLFDALRRARRYGVGDVRLYAQGARFLAGGEHGLAREARSFAAVIAGERDAVLEKPQPLDVYDAKGLAIELVERATRRAARAEHWASADRPSHLHPRGAARLYVGDALVGSFGPLHPSTERALDLGGEAFVIELDLEALEQLGTKTPRFAPIPTLPASSRDLAVVVHDDVLAGAVESAIREAAGELCESVAIFDLFRGGSVPAEHRSLAFHVVYRDPKAATAPDEARTLTDAEVDQRHAAVVKAVTERFGAALRA